MLCGILNRRELAVSCEAYCSVLSAGGSLVSPELGAAYALFQSLFESIAESFKADSTWWESIERPVFETNLRGALTSVLLYVCCSDLPPSLPVLISSGLHDSYAPVEAVKLLKAYLASESEDSVVRAASLGFLGLQGLPAFTAPHSRRTDLSYDQAYINSVSNLQKLSSDSDGGSDLFAMRCRSYRVEAFVVDAQVVEVLKVACLFCNAETFALICTYRRSYVGRLECAMMETRSPIKRHLSLGPWQWTAWRRW